MMLVWISVGVYQIIYVHFSLLTDLPCNTFKLFLWKSAWKKLTVRVEETSALLQPYAVYLGLVHWTNQNHQNNVVMSPAAKQVCACMALPGPWFVQPALVGCILPHVPTEFATACKLSPKMSQYIPSLSSGKYRYAPQADVRTCSRGKKLRFCCYCNRTNLRTNIEMYICLHHGCWCNHGSCLLFAFSKLVHAKLTATVCSGLEHEKAAILHQMSFVSIFLFFVFSASQSLITGTDEICPWLYL